MTDPTEPTAPGAAAPDPTAATPEPDPLAGLTEEQKAELEERVAQLRDAEAKVEDAPVRPIAVVIDRIEQLLAHRRAHPDPAAAAAVEAEYGPAWDDTRAHQAQVRQQAWHNDLVAAEQEALAHWTIDRLDADQHPDALRRYVGQMGPQARVLNLILAGRVGPGKTSAAIAVGNAAAGRGFTVRFAKHSTYLRWLRPDQAPPGLTAGQVQSRYRRCDLLILDDLGADLHVDGPAREFVQRETNELVGDRLTAGRFTVYTTNLSAEDIKKVLGARAYSRVAARAVPLTFAGKDRRAPVTW